MRQPWHALGSEAVLAALQSSASGLSAADAAERLRIYGPNAVPSAPPVSPWRLLAGQFRSVVVWLLIAATVVAASVGERADAAAIVAVLVLNVAIGFVLELRASRAVESLARLQPRRAVVLRDGSPTDADAADLVPGDILVLDAGGTIAADARLIASSELRTTESLLTGESHPVSKNAAAAVDDAAPLAERPTMVYAGTTAAAGSGLAVVVETGSGTELGQIGVLVQETRADKTPLERRLDVLGRQLVWIALGVAAITVLIGRVRGVPIGVLLESALALAVAAVPEGLPVVATITLALGVRRMARRSAIVRRLPAVETLGSVTVLCTDKTGTLTAGAMTVTRIDTADATYTVSGEGYEPHGAFMADGAPVDVTRRPELLLALRLAMIVNHADVVLTDDGWRARGDPTEAALAAAARKAGLDRLSALDGSREVSELPFSSDRQFMAIFHSGEGGRLIVSVKGSPERVIALCDHVQESGNVRPLDDASRRAWMERNDAMTVSGLRIIAVATGVAAGADEGSLTGLTLVGLLGMTDPPAAGVREAVGELQAAGIATVMITGDQSGTACAVAQQLGLRHAGVLDGRTVDAMSDAMLEQRLGPVDVFTRVRAATKVRIVEAFQRRGAVVAMIGDGVNDAAALKRADVGVTMGRRGTDVARETAAVVLQDDRFETIVVAVREGRTIYDNIRKFVFYLFSCNLAEVLVLLGGGLLPTGLPLTPIQILWMNLVTDTLPALALALEPGEVDVMDRPPRSPEDGLLTASFLSGVVGYAAIIAASVFACIAWSAFGGVPVGQAITMNFMALSLAQVFHLGNARSRHAVLTAQSSLSNPAALAAVAVVLTLQVATVWWAPLARFLGTAPLTAMQWLIVLMASAAPALAGQIVKTVRRAPAHRQRSRRAA